MRGNEWGMSQADVWFGRRLEPAAGKILHGAGQSDEEFWNYFAVMEQPPLIYMSYCGLRQGIEDSFERLAERLNRHPETWVIPQIGLSMTKDGSPEHHYEQQVASGEHDENILAMCRGLKLLNRPVFLRVGYEFNGHWNGYEPETYVAAWRRLAHAIRAHGLNEVALVWCYAPDDESKDFLSYYPGDEWVDWWGVDCFDQAHFKCPSTLRFMELSLDREFPVMIGESTPRHVGVLDGARSWRQWFVPFFRFMEAHRNLKAFCYISWDWAKYEQWKDWGNCRIGVNREVLDAYKAEMRKDCYLHGGPEHKGRAALGLA